MALPVEFSLLEGIKIMAELTQATECGGTQHMREISLVHPLLLRLENPRWVDTLVWSSKIHPGALEGNKKFCWNRR